MEWRRRWGGEEEEKGEEIKRGREMEKSEEDRRWEGGEDERVGLRREEKRRGGVVKRGRRGEEERGEETRRGREMERRTGRGKEERRRVRE